MWCGVCVCVTVLDCTCFCILCYYARLKDLRCEEVRASNSVAAGPNGRMGRRRMQCHCFRLGETRYTKSGSTKGTVYTKVGGGEGVCGVGVTNSREGVGGGIPKHKLPLSCGSCG